MFLAVGRETRLTRAGTIHGEPRAQGIKTPVVYFWQAERSKSTDALDCAGIDRTPLPWLTDRACSAATKLTTAPTRHRAWNRAPSWNGMLAGDDNASRATRNSPNWSKDRLQRNKASAQVETSSSPASISSRSSGEPDARNTEFRDVNHDVSTAASGSPDRLPAARMEYGISWPKFTTQNL